MANEISFPFGGDIYYSVETGYGTGLTGTLLHFSDAVTDVRIETGDINTALRTISEPSIADFSRTLVDPMLHLEWVLQPNVNDFEKKLIDRTNCDLDSLAFEVAVNQCSSGSDTYYYLKGCKCKTFTISASQGENYTCSADFSVSTVTTHTAAQGTPPVSALGTEYAAFNIAGSVTWSSAGTWAGAYVTNSLDVTIDNNIQDLYDVGSKTKKAAIPGAIDVTGSCDLSVDDGGKTFWDDIKMGVDITSVVFNTGLTTGNCGKITLNNGRFDSHSIDVNTSGEGMISSVPFTFKMMAITTGT